MGDLSHVAVLTVNYRSHHLLRRNLAQLSAQAPELTVVVCDNFTDDIERAAVSDLARDNGWTFVASPDNGGFAKGTNAAARAALQAGAEYLLLLNPDASVDVASVSALAAAVQADPNTLAVPLLFDAMGRAKAPARQLRLADGTMTPPPSKTQVAELPGHAAWLTGACLMVSAQLWRSLDGLAEEYFMYWEDVEFSYRAATRGARLLIVPEARCVHDQGGSQRSAQESDPHSRKTPMYFYFAARNRLLFASRNLGPAQQRAWAASSRRVAWATLRQARGRRRALLQSQKRALVDVPRSA